MPAELVSSVQISEDERTFGTRDSVQRTDCKAAFWALDLIPQLDSCCPGSHTDLTGPYSVSNKKGYTQKYWVWGPSMQLGDVCKPAFLWGLRFLRSWMLNYVSVYSRDTDAWGAYSSSLKLSCEVQEYPRLSGYLDSQILHTNASHYSDQKYLHLFSKRTWLGWWSRWLLKSPLFLQFYDLIEHIWV